MLTLRRTDLGTLVVQFIHDIRYIYGCMGGSKSGYKDSLQQPKSVKSLLIQSNTRPNSFLSTIGVNYLG